MAAVNCDNGVLSGGGDGSGQECITSHAVGGRLKSYRYYISRCMVMEMLSNRGYNVPDSDLTFSVAHSLTEFCTVFGQNPDLKCLCICVSLRSNPKKKVPAFLFLLPFQYLCCPENRGKEKDCFPVKMIHFSSRFWLQEISHGSVI